MSEILRDISIPKEFVPLYEAKTAHDAIKAAKEILTTSPKSQQTELLKNQIFVKIVQSAIDGVDQCRNEHIEELIGSVAEENQVFARIALLTTSPETQT